MSTNSYAIRASKRRTTYFSCHTAEKRTTYVLEVFKGTQNDKRQYGPLEACTAFLAVNRECYELGVEYLYDRKFWFLGGAECALAFLHDHKKKEHRLSKMTLQYVASDTKIALATMLRAWRRLFNVLVHEREDLRQVTVRVGGFWDVYPWTQDAQSIIKHRTKQHKDEEEVQGKAGQERTFFEHVSRLPGKSGELDLIFKLVIEGDRGDRQKEACVARLERELRERIRLRRPIARPGYGCCKEKKLEDSCYWMESRPNGNAC